MLARESVKEAEEIIKPRAKKLTQKLVLQNATEALEDLSQEQKEQMEKETRELLELAKHVAEEKKETEQVEKQKQKQKECPDDKELNPNTNRCVKKCEEDKIRNEEFKCVKTTKKTTRKAKPKTNLIIVD